jgi:hypothetical protein
MNDPAGRKKTTVRHKKEQIKHQLEIITDAN